VYLTIATIADDFAMQRRVSAAAAQEGAADAGIDPSGWALEWRLIWAAAPDWAEAWESALAAENPSPGTDPAVITDAQILGQVQTMTPFTHIGG
jgi:hypothetical protein